MDSSTKFGNIAKINAKESASLNSSVEDDVLGSERLCLTESEDENPDKSSGEQKANLTAKYVIDTKTHQLFATEEEGGAVMAANSGTLTVSLHASRQSAPEVYCAIDELTEVSAVLPTKDAIGTVDCIAETVTAEALVPTTETVAADVLVAANENVVSATELTEQSDVIGTVACIAVAKGQGEQPIDTTATGTVTAEVLTSITEEVAADVLVAATEKVVDATELTEQSDAIGIVASIAVGKGPQESIDTRATETVAAEVLAATTEIVTAEESTVLATKPIDTATTERVTAKVFVATNEKVAAEVSSANDANVSVTITATVLAELTATETVGAEFPASKTETVAGEVSSAITNDTEVSATIIKTDASPGAEVSLGITENIARATVGNEHDGHNTDDTEIQYSVPGNKKISYLIDSDVDSDEGGKSGRVATPDEADDETDESLPSFKSRKRLSSDSSGGGRNKFLKNQKFKKMTPLVESDSDEDKENPPKERSKKLKFKASRIIDSDSKTESSTDDSAENSAHSAEEAGENIDNKLMGSKKQMRAAAKKALDDMQEVQSEQQRLHREANINVPYHKPQAHSLKEFLQRHTRALPAKPIKMTNEELEEYVKIIDARCKEAEQFFKSEVDTPDKSQSPNINRDTEETEDMAVGDLSVPSETSLRKLDLTGSINTEGKEMHIHSPLATCDDPEGGKDMELNSATVSTVVTPACCVLTTDQEIIDQEFANPLRVYPTLSGKPNMVIDLDTGEIVPKETNQEYMWKRLIASCKPRREQTAGQKLNISSDRSHGKEHRPGAQHVELKNKLQEQMRQRREEYMRMLNDQKKRLEALEDAMEDLMEDEEDDKSTHESSEDMDGLLLATSLSQDVNLQLVDVGSVDDFAGSLVDSGQEDSDDGKNRDGNDDSDGDDGDEESGVSSPPVLERKSRSVKSSWGAEEDSDDIDDDIRSLLAAGPYYCNIPYVDEDEDEAAGAEFVASQQSQRPLMSQMPVTQNNNDGTEELLELCSGTFEDIQTQQGLAFEDIQTQQGLAGGRKRCRLSSDSDTAEQSNDSKKRTKLPKRTAKLGFSDDEESDEGEQKYGTQILTEEEIAHYANLNMTTDENDEPPTYVDYDSEENEIEVPLTKKQRLDLAAKNFVEREAELSGSEVGSDDEDERNMNEYDIELGDEDDFDREIIQQELGKIHARKMLDEDLRDVRRLQEIFVEDEERDGVGRERQFKWKNSEAGFTLDTIKEDNSTAEADDSGEERDEHLMRKKRFEREQMLQQNDQQLDMLPSTSSGARSGNSLSSSTKRITIIKGTQVKQDKVDAKPSSPFLIAKGSPFYKKSARGSYLVSDQATMTKLAGLTKGFHSGAVEDGTAGTVSVKSVKPSNFVFTTLSAQEHEQNLKRKADEETDSANSGSSFSKKQKKTAPRDGLIDRLQ